MAVEAVQSVTAYQGSASKQTKSTGYGKKSIPATATSTEVKDAIADDTDNKKIIRLDEESRGQNNGREALKKAVDEINKNAHNSEAIFGFHDETNRVTIKIIDKDTKKVLREFPPEETLDMIAKVWELAGLTVDEKL